VIVGTSLRPLHPVHNALSFRIRLPIPAYGDAWIIS
jgi:hypothetical protein